MEKMELCLFITDFGRLSGKDYSIIKHDGSRFIDFFIIKKSVLKNCQSFFPNSVKKSRAEEYDPFHPQLSSTPQQMHCFFNLCNTGIETTLITVVSSIWLNHTKCFQNGFLASKGPTSPACLSIL